MRQQTAAETHFGVVRKQPRDLSDSHDGSEDKCHLCNNVDARIHRSSKGRVHLCSKCPKVWHYQCIPNGKPKPRKDEEGWMCPLCC